MTSKVPCRHSEFVRAKMARKFALVYHENGRFQDEMELLEKSLEGPQKKQDSEDVGILYGMSDLTENYGNIAYARGVELYEKVLEAKQRIYGSEHQAINRTLNEIANCYSYLGRYQDAAELGKILLEADQRVLGNEHPDTLKRMNNLMTYYNDLGRI